LKAVVIKLLKEIEINKSQHFHCQAGVAGGMSRLMFFGRFHELQRGSNLYLSIMCNSRATKVSLSSVVSGGMSKIVSSCIQLMTFA
jgi:hypothetical protein